jgi:hypothetical protein
MPAVHGVRARTARGETLEKFAFANGATAAVSTVRQELRRQDLPADARLARRGTRGSP